MKARIFGTDMIVECLEISWRGDQPGIKCTYLNEFPRQVRLRRLACHPGQPPP